eukprot:2187135-Amphidinium_carterae.1
MSRCPLQPMRWVQKEQILASNEDLASACKGLQHINFSSIEGLLTCLVKQLYFWNRLILAQELDFDCKLVLDSSRV